MLNNFGVENSWLMLGGVKLVESHLLVVYKEVVETVRPRGRGFAWHRRVMRNVPDPAAYRIGDIVYMHPETAARFREIVLNVIAEQMNEEIKQLTREVLGVPSVESAPTTTLTAQSFLDAIIKTRPWVEPQKHFKYLDFDFSLDLDKA